MSWAEKELRDAFQGSLTAAGVGGGADDQCPPSEQVWDAVNLELAPSLRREIVSHTTQCAPCALVWQAAVSVSREAAVQEDGKAALPGAAPQPEPRPSWWEQLLRPTLLGPALAGAAALVVAVVWLDRPAPLGSLPPAEPSGVLRGAGSAGVTPADHASELGVGDTLRWSAASDAQGYELVLLGSSGLRVQRVVKAPFYELDSAALEPFSPGETISWSVAVVGGSTSGQVSPEQSFVFTD